MPATATLSDLGELKILGTDGDDHVLARQTLTDINVSYRLATGPYMAMGSFPSEKVKSLVVDLNQKGVNFFDGHGLHGFPKRVINAFDADNWGACMLRDINQRASPDCGHEAGLGCYIYFGNRPIIQYMQPTQTGARYFVRVGNTQGVVDFDGRMNAMDQAIERPYVFWNILEHRMWRAMALKYGAHAVNIIVYLRGTDPVQGQFQVENYAPLPNDWQNQAEVMRVFNKVQIALAMGKIIIAETNFGTETPGPFRHGPVDDHIVAAHQYSWLRAAMVNGVPCIVHRNPWGVDNYGNRPVMGEPNDGIGTLPLSRWIYSIQNLRTG